MREYELMFIVAQSDIKQGYQEKLIEEVRVLIDKHGGRTLRVRPWGLRELAYDIKGHRRGYYVIMQMVMAASKIQALEKFLLDHERVLRHIFIKLNEREMTASEIEILQNKVSEDDLAQVAQKKGVNNKLDEQSKLDDSKSATKAGDESKDSGVDSSEGVFSKLEV